MPPFATAQDVATILQRDLTAADTATVETLLDYATAVVKTETGQQFQTATSTITVRPRRGKIRLPQRPVTTVVSVEDTNGVAVHYQFDGVGTITSSPILIANGPDEPYPLPNIPLTIEYTHGYAAVPDDVKAVVVQMVGRAFGITPDKTGVSQESIGSYSYGVGAAAAQGPVGLLAGERAILAKYRLPASAVALLA